VHASSKGEKEQFISCGNSSHPNNHSMRKGANTLVSCLESFTPSGGEPSHLPKHKAKCWKVLKEKWRMVMGRTLS
jgi:hypothetical protein